MARKVFLDTDFLSSFLCIGKINYLTKVLPNYEVIVPFQTAAEIKRSFPIYKDLKTKYYIAKTNQDFREEVDFEADSPEYVEYLHLLNAIGYPKAIGSGEAAGIVLARKYNGVLASNNLSDVSYFVKHFNIPLITACDILLALFDQGFLSEKDLSKVYDEMVKQGRQLPFPSFSELLQARKEGKTKQRPIP